MEGEVLNRMALYLQNNRFLTCVDGVELGLLVFVLGFLAEICGFQPFQKQTNLFVDSKVSELVNITSLYLLQAKIFISMVYRRSQ